VAKGKSRNAAGRAQAGNALVEFAVIAPFMIVLIVGIIDLGRFAFFSIQVANAARAGAAYGSQSIGTAFNPTGMAAAVVADVSPNPIGTITASPAPTFLYGCYDTTNASLATPFPAATTASGGCSVSTQTPVPYVKVNATGTLSSLFKVPFIPQNITITSTSIMRVQCTVTAGAGC
jgi:Flp pilus assembly protein TadG